MNGIIRKCSTGAALLIASGVVRADVVFDGTLGPAGTLSGAFEISNAYGTQVGPNLFHSFTTFNVNAGESATFTSNFAGPTTNVIGRITGGALSTIDTVIIEHDPGRELVDHQPAGLVFGANAVLDVDGGFHASTADFLLLGDGSRFDATAVAGTVLTIANPVAFNFLDPTIAPISGGAVLLEVGQGQRLSLVGGDVMLNGTTLHAPNGAIALRQRRRRGHLEYRPRASSGSHFRLDEPRASRRCRHERSQRRRDSHPWRAVRHGRKQLHYDEYRWHGSRR